VPPHLLPPPYKPSPIDDQIAAIRARGIIVRRGNPWEITPTREFIGKHFAGTWADEVSVGFANKPVTVFLAVVDGAIVGFGAYAALAGKSIWGDPLKEPAR